MKNLFIKSRRGNIARCGGSGGSDFNTAFHKGWREKFAGRANLFKGAIFNAPARGEYGGAHQTDHRVWTKIIF